VLKGRFIQLGSEAVACSLNDAEVSFLKALEIDEDYVPALVDLAWFYYAVMDDSTKALPLFERAIKVSIHQITEAVEGKMKCLEELRSPEEARGFLRQVSQGLLDVKELEDKLDE
jgi:tetratricopeptide (TPR) repeat protein